jgi:hypothetical protein
LSDGPNIGPQSALQCQVLISAINEEQAKERNSNEEDLLKLAAALDGMVKSLGEVSLWDPKLKGFRADFQKICADLANAARDAASGGGDDRKRQAAIEVMGTVGPREDKLVEEINAYCAQTQD